MGDEHAGQRLLEWLGLRSSRRKRTFSAQLGLEPAKMDDLTNRLIVTKRLIVMTGFALVGMTVVFAVAFSYNQRLMMSFLAFSSGIIGGFVSIQQRLKTIGQEELVLLAKSWFQIVLVPIFGGVFALVLYCMFLSGLVAGDVFPTFFIPAAPESGPDTAYMQSVLTRTYPNSGPDLAKFIFWSFVAGFSERFVLNFVDSTTVRASPEKPADESAAGKDSADGQPAPSAIRPVTLNPGQN